MPLAERCLLLFNGDSWVEQTGLHAVHMVVLVWLWQHAILWLLSIFTTQSLYLDLWHTCCLTRPANTAHWQSVCFVGQILFLLLICSVTVSISPRLLLGHFSPPLLIFSFGNRPALFPGRMSCKATKSGFSFFCLFCVVVHFFWLVNECFCCVWFIFVHTKPRDWLGETSPKWPILCRVRCKTTTQSVNQPTWGYWLWSKPMVTLCLWLRLDCCLLT